MMMPLASRSCAMHDMRRQIILLVLYSTSSSTVDLTMHEPARFYPGLSVLISTTDLPLRCRPAQRAQNRLWRFTVYVSRWYSINCQNNKTTRTL